MAHVQGSAHESDHHAGLRRPAASSGRRLRRRLRVRVLRLVVLHHDLVVADGCLCGERRQDGHSTPDRSAPRGARQVRVGGARRRTRQTGQVRLHAVCCALRCDLPPCLASSRAWARARACSFCSPRAMVVVVLVRCVRADSAQASRRSDERKPVSWRPSPRVERLRRRPGAGGGMPPQVVRPAALRRVWAWAYQRARRRDLRRGFSSA